MSLKVKKTIIKSMLLVFCFASLSLTASAAGLGKLNVLSSLGEPLNAEIDLLTTPEELLSLNASLASDDQYLAQGIDKSVIQKNIQISVVKKPEGISVLKIVSSQAVTDPFLDMLIQVSWNEGKLSREYTLLLDPPGQNDAYVESPEVDAPNAQSANEDSLATVKPGKSNAISKSVKSIPRSGSFKTKQGLTEGQKITISKGDTLGTIAKRLQVVDVNLDQMLIGLFKANPMAFKDGNINRLIIGQVLDVPNAEVLQQFSKEAARNEVRAQVQSWSAYTAKLADEVTQSEISTSESNHQNGGKIVTKTEENLTPESEGPHDVVKLAKSASASPSKNSSDQQPQAQLATNIEDDIAAKRNDIKESDEKAAVLTNQIADMKKLLAIKNKAMADAQQAPSKIIQTHQPKRFVIWILAGIVLLFIVFMAWTRHKRQISAKHLGNISKQIAVNAKHGVNQKKQADKEVVTTPTERASEIDVPEVSTVDLSSISLDFDAAEKLNSNPSDKSPAPIPEVFEGDLSSILNLDMKPQAPKAPRKKRVTKVVSSDIDTKLELAVAYVDMADKKGALKLLKQVLKEGSLDQRQRAQALIDGLA